MNMLKIQILCLTHSWFLYCPGASGRIKKLPLFQRVGLNLTEAFLSLQINYYVRQDSRFTFPGGPVDLALTPDGKYLLVKNKDDLDLIRLSDRKVMQSLPFEKSGASFTGICLSPDGNRDLCYRCGKPGFALLSLIKTG